MCYFLQFLSFDFGLNDLTLTLAKVTQTEYNYNEG